MKKCMKFFLKLAAIGAFLGGIFAYLKSKGFITITTEHGDEDYDDFSCPDNEGSERTYIHVDTEAMKARAKEMAQDMKVKAGGLADACMEKTVGFAEKAQDTAEEWVGELKDKAEDAYDEAKKMANTAKDNIAATIEKAWYNVEDKAEKVEEFFHDED